MQEAYTKLYEVPPAEICDTMYWMQASLHKICRSFMSVPSVATSKDSVIDKHFFNDAAHSENRKSWKFEVHSREETSCLTAIRLDVFDTGIKGSFAPQLSSFYSPDHSPSESYFPLKGGAIPCAAIWRFNTLFSIAPANFLLNPCNCFTSALCYDQLYFQEEVEVQQDGSEEQKQTSES